MGSTDGCDYYDINSILADEVLIPCSLVNGCTGVGMVIDPSSDVQDLDPDTNVELPLWMVSIVAGRHLVQVSLPLFYRDRMRRKMKAGAGCEDLRIRCGYFYTAAGRVHDAMEATGQADETFPAFIMSTFVNRYKELLTRAPVVESGPEAFQVQSKLTVEELKLFNAASAAAAAHERWRANKENLMRSNSLKRKRPFDRAPLGVATNR